MSKILNNPKQIAGLTHSRGKGKAIVFAIQNELDIAKCENKNEPLNLHSKFSRFPVVIINENNRPATANIPVNEMLNIIMKSKTLHDLEIKQACTPHNEEFSSPAYTVRFTSGDMRGMTPAEVLLKDPENSKKLNEQYTILKENLPKYPKNKKQLDAITDAARLYKEGKLQKSERTVIPSYLLYESGFRPLTRREKKDGLTFVYQIKLTWNFGESNPVRLEIENFYAPVIQTEQGLLNVQAKEKKNSTANEFHFSLDEWNWLIHLIESNIRIFEAIAGPKALKIATNMAEEKKEKFAL